MDKCEVMPFGNSNESRTYTVNGRALECVAKQRDLGADVHHSLKGVRQVVSVVKKAYGTLTLHWQQLAHHSAALQVSKATLGILLAVLIIQSIYLFH